ncbi:nucleotide sugar dehydrogenase [Clostridium perfringens]|uniref:nucleotide sugar dehydrogenase n=1 Tax=Clostridium perfringens TaxID=1502 RepID=UPI000DF0EF6F|nr:nucleotide sugar dehydrogenase [Clostridium perfringens]ELC8396109.1 nucleotide sugar dehydrogenase [Clostridium perfringens]MBO3362410.1 nucleotide sugar dehydrogenase [Clostridium perfringens]MDK0806880.1 nucleotide sugar dehydrogenase [Clostridium perfringens]STB42551.1 UDP-glucose/GDP-mannose dehydrogenase [Clostridium perfringens]
MKKLNIIGLGYIGLPTALSFASAGIEVIGTDYNKGIVDTLNNGQVTFKEDGLYDLYKEALNKGIEFSTEYAKTNKYIITVPTPYIKESKKLDAKYVISAVESVLDVCDKGTILVIESTVSPGTMDKFVRPIVEDRGFIIGEDIHLVHAPERIIPGNMVNELKNNSRTIGADNIEIGYEVKRWYETFCNGEIVVTDIKTAELSKVVENTFRDINIAFANELSRICRKENMDVYELINIANKHPRVNILTPGPGVGGHCISVDPWFLVGDYPEIVNVIKAAREVNDSQPDFVIDRIRDVMNENGITDISKVGLYGLTYKENVDDLRESPTLQILEKLERYFVKGIKVYDPWIEEKKFENQYNNFNEFLNEVELVVVLVAHDHIKEFKDMVNNKLVLDTKNIFENKSGIYKL